MNAIADAVCLASSEGDILFESDRFRGLDPGTREKVRDLAAAAAETFTREMASGVRTDLLSSHEIPAMGEARWYEAQFAPVRESGPEGDLRCRRVAVVLRDITAAKQRQECVSAVELAGRELMRFDAETVRKLNVMERLRLLESRIVRQAKAVLGFEHFAIRVIDERSGRLQLVMSSGLPAEAGEFDLHSSTENNGIAGWVAATGSSHICPDSEQDPRFLPALTGARSCLVVPLRLHEKVIGVLDIESPRVGAFKEGDRNLAEVFARYIAMALNVLEVLVVERSATNETVTGRVEGELSEPLEDILHEADALHGQASRDPELASHIERIRSDVDAIRRRMRNVAAGPQTLLGVERAMAERRQDPLMVGRRVLVADDEQVIRRIIGDVLKNRGAEVVTCADGAEAIKRVEEAADGRIPPFDLVVSDIKMPDRNGYEVFAAARKGLPGAPVILMTGFGYDPHHSIVRASQEGLQSVLFKPFQVERLLEEVRKALTAKGG